MLYEADEHQVTERCDERCGILTAESDHSAGFTVLNIVLYKYIELYCGSEGICKQSSDCQAVPGKKGYPGKAKVEAKHESHKVECPDFAANRLPVALNKKLPKTCCLHEVSPIKERLRSQPSFVCSAMTNNRIPCKRSWWHRPFGLEG